MQSQPTPAEGESQTVELDWASVRESAYVFHERIETELYAVVTDWSRVNSLAHRLAQLTEALERHEMERAGGNDPGE
jgi:hypothetical protein